VKLVEIPHANIVKFVERATSQGYSMAKEGLVDLTLEKHERAIIVIN